MRILKGKNFFYLHLVECFGSDTDRFNFRGGSLCESEQRVCPVLLVFDLDHLVQVVVDLGAFVIV